MLKSLLSDALELDLIIAKLKKFRVKEICEVLCLREQKVIGQPTRYIADETIEPAQKEEEEIEEVPVKDVKSVAEEPAQQEEKPSRLIASRLAERKFLEE